MVKKEKSLKINMIINAFKGILSIAFPLITFPYISRVLGVTNIGKYNFSTSIISYCLLIAALGIKTYAVREGAKLRENRKEFEKFASQMFSINLFSTIVAYIILFIVITIVPKMVEYREILLILSLQILFTTLGVEWVYTVYEEFTYITVLNLFSHIISLVLMFLLVKTSDDLNVYAGIVVFASVGSNIVNFVHCKKYCNLKLRLNIDWKKHTKPILILFSMQIATTIYISSDTTILGFLCNDDIVGIYSVSTKVYSIIKTILSSIIIVSIPRLASMLGKNNKKEFNVIVQDIYYTLLTVIVPAIVGMIILRKQIVLIISSEAFLEATSSLLILCIALIFCLCAWFWGQCILVPLGMEVFVFKSTLLSAIINIILNFIMIPLWAENAAAITTVIAEAVAFLTQWWKGRKYVDIKGIPKILSKISVGCCGIVVVCFLLHPLIDHIYIYTILSVLFSFIAYFVIEIALKNESVFSIVEIAKKKCNINQGVNHND